MNSPSLSVHLRFGAKASKAGATYSYMDALHAHAVTSIGGEQRYWYDPNGNMTTRVEISGGQRITYTQGWDIDNRLVAITSTLGAIATTTYAYDANGQRVTRSDISGTTIYVGPYYEVQLSSGITTSYYTFGAQRVAMRTGSNLYWIHSDHLGSASLTTDASGTVVSEMRYYPYGEVRWISGTMPTDHTFTGQRVEGSLMDYGARFYSPILGRFISADSIVPQPVDPQSLNRYSYVRNNPLVRIDPSGHTDCDAGNTQCWIDQYVAKANWYRQNLAFRWLANNHVNEETKIKVEAFYKNLLDDPAAFIKRFLDVASFGRSDESTYLMLLTTETNLDYRSPEQLVSAVVEDIVKDKMKSPSAARAVLYARQRNQNDPSSDVTFVSLAGGGGLLISAAAIAMDEAIELAIRFVGGDANMMMTGKQTNYQFMNMYVDYAGNRTTVIGRLDVNIADLKVAKNGAHLNLEIQANGKVYSEHYPIDPMTIREGDYP